MIDLPRDYIDSIKNLLGEESSKYFECLSQPSYKGLRVNTKKISCAEFEKISPFKLARVPWTDCGYYIEDNNGLEPGKHPYYGLGLYYLQEPSAMTPASYLPVLERDIVLDLCAAPGGKATHLAQRARFVFANDISASRAQALLKNLEIAGAGNIAVTAESPEHLAESYPDFFDKILVDAPCSGEGMFRKDASLVKSWIEKGPEEYHLIQCSILDSAYEMLRPGGMLLYSTCTFSELEDEKTIKEFLAKHEDMHIEPFEKRYEDFEQGLTSYGDDFKHAARLYPHRIKGEGHFLVLLKKEGADNNITDNDRFCKNEIRKIGEKLYYIPQDFDVNKGIRYLRTGLLLGEYKKDKFMPAGAFALAYDDSIRIPDFNIDAFLELDISDERVMKYLRGDTIQLYEGDTNSKKGPCLIKVNQYPLGFGRLQNGRIKNDIPKGFIWH